MFWKVWGEVVVDVVNIGAVVVFSASCCCSCFLLGVVAVLIWDCCCRDVAVFVMIVNLNAVAVFGATNLAIPVFVVCCGDSIGVAVALITTEFCCCSVATFAGGCFVVVLVSEYIWCSLVIHKLMLLVFGRSRTACFGLLCLSLLQQIRKIIGKFGNYHNCGGNSGSQNYENYWQILTGSVVVISVMKT